MIKGLILAGMCAMGGHGVTQQNTANVQGEINVDNLVECKCGDSHIVSCGPRADGKTEVVLNNDGTDPSKAIDN